MNQFKQQILNKRVQLGTLISLPSTEIVEILSQLGYDWLWLDMEHSVIDFHQLQQMIQAIRGQCASVIRVPCNDEVWIKKALDIGCQGIIVPMVNSAEAARAAIQAAQFPPQGHRSVGGTRACSYGLHFQNYIAQANDEIAIMLQIEHIDAVNNIEAIVAVAGIDALIIGPFDLSASLGVLGHIQHQKVKQAIEYVKEVCFHYGIPLGIYTPTAEVAKYYIQAGFVLVCIGQDSSFIYEGARKLLHALQDNQ